jgi:cytochrome c5
MKKYLAVLIVQAMLSGCGSYFEKKDKNSAPSVGQDKTAGQAGIAFDEIKKKILEPSCIECHQNYAFYDSVKADLDKIVQTVETNRMPKNAGPLSDEQKRLIMDWIAGGAQNVLAEAKPSEPQVPAPVDDTLKPNWESLSKKIFFARCTVCHSANGQAKFLDLSSRQKIFEARNKDFEGKPLLNFEQPAMSYLLDVIQDPLEPMPPKSSQLQQLSEPEIEVLMQWIGLGLP